MLTANSTAAAAAKPAVVVEAERDQQEVAGEALQRPGRKLRHGRDQTEPRLAEHDQTRRARDRARSAPGCIAFARTVEAGAAGAVAQHDRREDHERQQDRRRDGRDQSAF